jgi:hypothetical protein
MRAEIIKRRLIGICLLAVCKSLRKRLRIRIEQIMRIVDLRVLVSVDFMDFDLIKANIIRATITFIRMRIIFFVVNHFLVFRFCLIS